jgi:hypothetical protein
VVSQRREEKERREREQAARAREKADAEAARREEREYRRAIEAGGDIAAEAKWERLYVQTLDATGSRYGLCQWDLPNGHPGACTNRTADVVCAKHMRQVDREAEQRRQERAASEASTPRAVHGPPVARVASSRSGRRSNWHRRASKPLDYTDPVYQRNRAQLLATKPMCHWCKVRPATTADHLRGAPEGGTHDLSNLVPACADCNRLRGASLGGKIAKANRRRRG